MIQPLIGGLTPYFIFESTEKLFGNGENSNRKAKFFMPSIFFFHLVEKNSLLIKKKIGRENVIDPLRNGQMPRRRRIEHW